MNGSITIRHNMEMAHRLSLTPGKCQNIHGHSWWVELEMFGELDEYGLLEGIDFGDAKKVFRHYLDTEYDHHLLLNDTDPWAQPIGCHEHNYPGAYRLPGLRVMQGDPTTENIAARISWWAACQFELPVTVVVHETNTNTAKIHTGHVHEPAVAHHG